MSVQQQFMVAALTETHEVISPFMAEMPQHCTVLPWMYGYMPQATTRLQSVLANESPIETVIGNQTIIDYNDEAVSAWAVESGGRLEAMRQTLAGIALQGGTRQQSPHIALSSPHIAIKANHTVRNSGDQFIIKQLSVLTTSATPGEKYFRMYRTILLGQA